MWWQIKWVKDAAFGLLPFSGALRGLIRRLRPYPTCIPEWTFAEGLRQIELLREAGCSLHGATVLEVGSGWRPIIPLLFSLAGAARVVLVDSQRLMDAPTFAGTARNLAAGASFIAARLGLEEAAVRTALADPPHDLGESLRRFRFEYQAPCNIISAPLEDGQFDVVTSRAVLEHVPPHVLRPLLGRTFRLLRPGGWACHAVDNSDHWSHSRADRRLSRVNFLRYSDRFFGFLNWFNPLDYQNRLRHPEYAALLRELGFDVVIARSKPDPKALADLKTLPLAPRFRAFAP
jgi:SAM-dependent methyltransferase